MVGAAVLSGGACAASETAEPTTTTPTTEVLVEIGQTELAAHQTDVDNEAWIVGTSTIARGSDLRVRATWCPTPHLLINGERARAEKYFDPAEDTGVVRDLVTRVPADMPAGGYDLMLVCVNDFDVGGRVRETTIEIAGPTVSDTPISDVDPSLQPTIYCRRGDVCTQLQPYPPGFPIGES